MSSTRTCPSCRIRFRVPPPTWNRDYNAIRADENVIRILYRAAALFDLNADEPHTAREFVEWILPDLRGGATIGPEFEGVTVKEGGARNGSMATRHASPDPLPMVPSKLRKMVS